ncbi:MAG TPA: class I SAM-dependent methyltransferase [Anaerolineae bacterium]|nr:class I SAM-dependent methyltransferase [Anaerolineae bacterium]
MSNTELQTLINTLYDPLAEKYDSEEGHGMTEPERNCWRADILAVADFLENQTVLDVGTGTGELAELLSQEGCQIVGIDPAENMVAQARKKFALLPDHKVTFRVADTHYTPLFEAQSFDWIVSRQVVCHLYDPLLAFRNWHNWLKPGGQVMLIDGLWSRQGWSNSELVDQLPLSCLQTRATVSYLLENSGFKMGANQWLERVNAYLAHRQGESVSLRYVIQARKA